MSKASLDATHALENGHAPLAIDVAQSAAERGDADALLLLAQWHLVGHPFPRDLRTARAFLRKATLAGSEDAALTEAALTANGTGAAPNWSEALSLLNDAAGSFGGPAADDLALLLQMDLDGQGCPKSLPEPESLGRNYTVLRWKQMFSPQECAHIAMSARDLLAPSIIADPRTGRNIAHPIRTSSAAVIGPTRESLPIQAMLRRIAKATGTHVQQGEPLSVLHYAPGQEYREHMDTLPGESNQRLATALIYLNSGYRGGETRFAEENITIAGGGGDMIAFSNITANGSPDPKSRHAGAPVLQGAKWMATRWIRTHAFDVWHSA